MSDHEAPKIATQKPYRKTDPGAITAARFAAKVGRCVICDAVALYRVGTRGYCKKHLDAATRQLAVVQDRREYAAKSATAVNDWVKGKADDYDQPSPERQERGEC